jgi:hypothetical protein
LEVTLDEWLRTASLASDPLELAELVPLRAEAAEQPSYLQPFEPVRYAKPPSQSGARMIIEEREGGW